MKLLDLLFPPRSTERTIRDLSYESLLSLLAPETVCGITHLLPYQHPWVRACIQEAKFHGNGKALRFLAQVLATYTSSLPSETVFVPIPLHPARKRNRGYNQVERILHAGGIAYQTLLMRGKNTAPQTSLPRPERVTNIRDAFFCPTPLSSIPIYVVVDDVTTTGSTLHEAKKTLESMGAARIFLLSLAH